MHDSNSSLSRAHSLSSEQKAKLLLLFGEWGLVYSAVQGVRGREEEHTLAHLNIWEQWFVMQTNYCLTSKGNTLQGDLYLFGAGSSLSGHLTAAVLFLNGSGPGLLWPWWSWAWLPCRCLRALSVAEAIGKTPISCSGMWTWNESCLHWSFPNVGSFTQVAISNSFHCL